MSPDCLLFVICICGISYVLSVDRSNFKQCRDSSFCRFHRNKEKNVFKLLPDTIYFESNHLHGHLKNYNGEDSLEFDLYGYKDGIVRFKINEESPLRKRYEIPEGDVVQYLEKQDFQIKSRDTNHILLITSDIQVSLKFEPFEVEVHNRFRKVVTINSRQLLHIFKSKMAKKKLSWMSWLAQSLNPFGEEEEHPDDQDWSEKFRSHVDSRPYGPSSIGLDVSYLNFSNIYGIPEHGHAKLALKSTVSDEPYRLYNLDVFEYEINNNMALYGSVPFMIAHNVDATVGMFWNNPSETWIDVEHDHPGNIETHWMSESGVIDVFVMVGPTPRDVFKQYSCITGSTPLPSLFSIAYHQSRWNYVDENDIASVSKGFDDNNIPMDVLWLDIEHTYDKRYFTFDSNKFPTPKKMLKKMSKTKRRMVTAIDPHLKKDSSHYKIYSAALRSDLLVKDKDGNEYEGWCWPGNSAWLDFTNPDVRQFWAERFLYSNYEGSTDHLFTWNDMNEPSVFNGPEITMHKDNIHHGDREHREIHNIYGLYVQRSSFEGQLLRSEGTARPFVLSRSFFAGSQKYGAVWTGDNAADWIHLAASLPMLMTLNLVGVTFSGADVGGFFKNPTPELLIRWYQAAAFQPFFRAHAHLDTKRREPWLFKPHEMDLIRAAIKVRYKLLPYWYLLFFQSETSGEPIMKPLWTEFPQELETFDISTEHLLGDSILVRPVTTMGAKEVLVYLPGCGEIWYDTNYKAYNGCNIFNYPVSLETIPTFYRGGKIVPIRERIRRSSMAATEDPYSLVVHLDSMGESRGFLYHDDFLSYRYKEGLYVYRNITYTGGVLTSRPMNSSTSFAISSWIERIYIIGLKSKINNLTINSEGVSRSLESTYNEENNVLVIRKPAVYIDLDFTIILNF